MSIAKLSNEQARDRVEWLETQAGRELRDCIYYGGGHGTLEGGHASAEAIDKLHEIARIARQTAKHYES